MTEPIITTPQPEYKDRRVFLTLFGLFYAAMGVLCLLLFVGMVLVALSPMTAEAGANTSVLLSTSLVYLLAGVWFIWLGVGSMLARRWARALILVSSWIWLVSGLACVLAIAAMFVAAFPEIPFMPTDLSEMPGFMLPMIAVVLVFYFVVFVVMPAVLVLVYGGRNIKHTVEACDQHVRWTDKCPLPVLAVSLVALVCAAFIPMGAGYNWFFPFFGIVLNGWNGAVAMVIVLAAHLYIAWGTYKLRMEAWWTALVTYVFLAISVAFTFAVVPTMDIYGKMGVSAQQLEAMRDISMPVGWYQGVMMAIWIVIVVGYLLYIRKYFTSGAPEVRPGQETTA